jgi:cobaltochelatase CobN
VDGFSVLSPDWAAPWRGPRPEVLQGLSAEAWRHAGHTRERLELLASRWVTEQVAPDASEYAVPSGFDASAWPQTAPVLRRMREVLRPRLDACGPQEMAQLLSGLAGRFVPPGPSGAPSRGRPDVLPTGRNFYSVDTRAVPTPTAYAMGAAAAERLIERHLQDHGEMPGAVGLSVWGTSTMRTGGEDVAQAFALLGVRPKWADGSARVVDIEVLPMAIRNRPRVDVTLRVSGFFRDAFPNVIDLFDTAVRTVAAISEADEPDDVNPIRARVQREAAAALAAGQAADTAQRQATWRVFGPRPGGYGVGVQEVLDSGRWQGGADIAQAYLQAGATAAVYHGDFSVPGEPRIRTLREEVARVVRSRAVNPKWLAGVQRHGYKGAFEIAATVDNLFAWDATTGVVGDHQYALMADAYLHDDTTREFLQRHNPLALRRIGERLLEAMQRGLWQAPGDHRERIEHHLLALERRLEEQGEGPMA